MKINNIYARILILLILISTNSYAQEETNILPDKERYELVEMQGTIQEINKETREVTLMGNKGELLTVTAGEDVKRFDEIEVGDVIALEYVKYLKAEFRQPTQEELDEPLVVVAGIEKAESTELPAGAVGAVITAVVTIQVINLPAIYVIIQGPSGNFTTINLESEELIQKLHVGQVVILTYAEAIALALAKVE